jgi:hypothetical protein
VPIRSLREGCPIVLWRLHREATQGEYNRGHRLHEICRPSGFHRCVLLSEAATDRPTCCWTFPDISRGGPGSIRSDENEMNDDSRRTPAHVVWDITYACPLRCSHCYSESGRRPSRQLDIDDLMKVTDALISLHPQSIGIAGGEPLLVKGLFDVAERVVQAGIDISLYTGGWTVPVPMPEPLARLFSRIVVSIDGATAAVHDRIRGRRGSFARAVDALQRIGNAVGERKATGGRYPWLGADFVVVRSNFHEMELFCSTMPANCQQLEFISFGAVIPSGLATHPEFIAAELLTESERGQLIDPAFRAHLQQLVPPSVQVITTDNGVLQMHPADIESGTCVPSMQVEPDGQVRAMSSYEGTVGSLLTEPPLTLWERAKARWQDPVVLRTLTPARTMQEWAAATRTLDGHFGSDDVKRRILRRLDPV